MTNNDIISQAVSDPLVIERHTQFKAGGAVLPSTARLQSLARMALQTELNYLLVQGSIRRAILEYDYTLTISDGTEVDQGVWFEMPSYVGSVVNVTIGSDYRPLTKKKTREDFDRWWYQRGGTSGGDASEVWTPWSRSADKDIKILISPGTGDDDEANVHYLRKVNQPVAVDSIFPDDMHFLVVMGTINRMTGFQLQGMYDEALRQVSRRLDPMVGGSSPMPHAKEIRDFCYIQSVNSSGPMTSSNPLFISRSQ